MRTPPRLIVRTLAVTFVTVAVILSVVFIVLMIEARDRVRNAETEKLGVSEQVFTAEETERHRERLAMIEALAEQPRIKAALDTYLAETAFGGVAAEQELDALATTFNDLMLGLVHAEAETPAAYLGAIRALAAALDARDPYTAGHSERVSRLSVLIARELKLPEADIDVIRLGALLHDIGKIGVSDEVLRKPGALSPEEFEQIKRHPALGARIVHVADAFDAMTSARAYRPSRGTSFAVEELQRCSGSEFDPACVDAICAALPSASSISEPQLQELLGRGV